MRPKHLCGGSVTVVLRDNDTSTRRSGVATLTRGGRFRRPQGHMDDGIGEIRYLVKQSMVSKFGNGMRLGD